MRLSLPQLPFTKLHRKLIKNEPPPRPPLPPPPKFSTTLTQYPSLANRLLKEVNNSTRYIARSRIAVIIKSRLVIQCSYRFLDPKFKTFSGLFSKAIISFSRLEVIKQVINRDLEKRRNSFFNDALQTCGRDRISLDQTENNFTYNVVAVALKTTTTRLFTIFPGVISIFQIFSRSGKLLGKLLRTLYCSPHEVR